MMSISVSPAVRSAFYPVDPGLAGEVEDGLARLIAVNEPMGDHLSNELGILDLRRVNGGEFRLGTPDTVSIGFDAESTLRANLLLKRADDERLDGFDGFLPEDVEYATHFLLAFSVETSTGIAGKAGVPIGGYFAAKGKAEASGGIAYRYCRVFPREIGSRDVLVDFLGNLRWPLCDASQAMERQPGDVAIARFRGELKLWGELELAYAVSGSRSLEMEGLEPSVSYEIGAGVRLGGAYELGGSFSVVSSTGGNADWLRLRIARTSMERTESHFGLDVRIGLETEGFATNPERLLTALTGFDAANVLSWLEKVATSSNLDQALQLIRKEAGERAGRLVEQLAGSLYRSQTFENLAGKVRKVVQQYETFKQKADARLLELVAEHVRTGEVAGHLEKLLDLTSREGLSRLSDGRTWEVVDKLAGDKVYELLSEEKLFAELRSRAAMLLNLIEGTGPSRPLLRLIEELESRYNVDRLVGKIENGLDRDTLLALAKDKSGDLLDLIFDVTAAELQSDQADAVLKRVSAAAERVIEFRDKTARVLADGLKKNLEVSLLQVRAGSDDASVLVDIEFNLASEKGRTLYDKARKGDFVEVLKTKDPGSARIHKGSFQESLQRSASLKVHFFGWEQQFEVGMEQVSRMEHVQQEAGGPLFLLSSETSQSMRNLSGFSQQESVQSVLQFGLQARSRGTQPGSGRVLVDLVESVNCSFDVLHKLSNPAWGNLGSAFRFAARLGLLDDPEALVAGLQREFGPGGPQEVSVTYRIGYDPEAYESLWNLELEENGEDRALVSRTFREALMDRWAYQKPGFFSEKTCELYLNHFRIRRLRTRRGHSTTIRYLVTDKDGNEQSAHWVTDALWKAYQAEGDMLRFLGELERALEAHEERPDWKRLNRALANFLSVPRLHPTARLWKGHLFFLVTDAILLAGSGNARKGKTLLQLDLVPARGEPVRRFYPDFLLA